MAFAWGHTTYAVWHDMIFNFEWKWDLDYFLAHAKGARRIRAIEAYASDKPFIKIEASCRRRHSEREKEVRRWHDNQRDNVQCGFA